MFLFCNRISESDVSIAVPRKTSTEKTLEKAKFNDCTKDLQNSANLPCICIASLYCIQVF